MRKTIKINLNGYNFHRRLIADMTWSQFFQTIGYYCICQKRKAAKVMADKVIKPRGLGNMYIAFVDGCHDELRTVSQ
jgi:hypothetical protein